jgi:acyl-CoA synthetase (AMP-forming)/AMP-acid ligase II
LPNSAARPGLPGLLDELLATEPDLPALVADGQTTTFSQWSADSELIASALAERGVGPGDMVVLMLPSGQDFASGYLAALRLGAIASAINPRLGKTEVEHILARCDPAVVITTQPARATGRARAVLTPDQARGLPGTTPSVTGWAATAADAPAAVIWTTGTTGLPKGAWFDHQTMAFIGANLGPLSAPRDRKLMPVPFAHTGYVTRIYDQVIQHSSYILTPPEWSAEAMLDLLATERITLGQGVPTQWEKLVRLDRLEDTDLSSLRLVSTGAARVSPALVRALHSRLKVPVVIRYASTEVPLAFGTRVDDPIEVVATTVGRALGGAEVEIRDPTGRGLSAGETGRIHLRTKAAMRGYWRDERQTGNAMTSDGWLASSDLGRLDADGNLAIVGRADDAYIRGGYNVYPSEVEAALSSHPGVARVTVVGAPAPVIGEIGVAFVVPAPPRTAGEAAASVPGKPGQHPPGEPGATTAARPAHGLSEAALRAWCQERIADYKVPDIVALVDDLPVNATFKVDTGQLKATAARLATERGRPRHAAGPPGIEQHAPRRGARPGE